MIASRGRTDDRRALRQVQASRRAEQSLVAELALAWRRCPALAAGTGAPPSRSKRRTNLHAKTAPPGQGSDDLPLADSGYPGWLRATTSLASGDDSQARETRMMSGGGAK